jgi:DNA-binding MarR family transcriptional regulator
MQMEKERNKRRRDQRLDEPKRMRLTERDRAIIEAVHLYRVLRQDQIQTLFFGTKSAAQRALARLYDHGFLERKFTPVLYGRSPTLYVLDKRGAELLRAERGYEDLVWYPSSKDLKTDFLEHTTAINDFRISIVVAAYRQGLELITWASETQMKADYARVAISGAQRPVSLVPDSYFVINTPLGRAHFFLELDRGTETLERFKQKAKAYVAYHASGGYEKRYGTKSLRVLCVVNSEGRLANLANAVKQVTDVVGGRRRFWFALASSITPETALTASIWYIAGEQQPRALLAPHE